jgi:hypothetical protein
VVVVVVVVWTQKDVVVLVVVVVDGDGFSVEDSLQRFIAPARAKYRPSKNFMKLFFGASMIVENKVM